MGIFRQFFNSVGIWMEDYGAIAAGAFSTSILAISSICISDEFSNRFIHQDWQDYSRAIAFYGVGIGVLLGIGAVIWQTMHDKRISDLIEANEDLNRKATELEHDKFIIAENVRNLVEGYLFRFATGPLSFGSRAGNIERVTLYLYDPDGHFISIGRFSENPTFRQPGKSQHSSSQGCIGKAWTDGWCFDNAFPHPDTAQIRYRKKQLEYGIEGATVDNFSMKSRLYCGCRIHSRDGQVPVAVLVIESTESDRFEEEWLREQLKRTELLFLSDLIESVSPHVAMPSEIAKLGF